MGCALDCAFFALFYVIVFISFIFVYLIKMSQKSKFWGWIDQRVCVDLRDQRAIIGTLIGFDKHLNFVVADASEFRSLKRKEGVV